MRALLPLNHLLSNLDGLLLLWRNLLPTFLLLLEGELQVLLDVSGDAFGVEGVAALVQSHIITERINEGHVKVVVVIGGVGESDDHGASSLWLVVSIFLAYELVKELLANVALSVTKQQALADASGYEVEGRERQHLRTFVGVFEHLKFQRSLSKYAQNHIS